MEELKILRDQVEKLDYPLGAIKKVNGEISGLGFFPAGDGLIGHSKKISERNFMILGQDQDNEVQFQRTIRENREDYSSTWRNLKEVLEESEVDLEDCFFTNCLMGIRKNVKSNTGKSPALTHLEFTKQCLFFLRRQIEIQKPKIIICLGLIPIKLISYLSKELLLKFIPVDNFKEIDDHEFAVNIGVTFDEILHFKSTVIVVTHPCHRKWNSKIRSFKNFYGSNAEVEMIKFAKTIRNKTYENDDSEEE